MIKPPILVFEPNDLCVFLTVEAAESYVEPWWVRNDEGVAYDSAARKLRFVTTSYRSRFLFFPITVESVKIVCDDDALICEVEVRRILTDFLGYLVERGRDVPGVKTRESLEGKSLAELVKLATYFPTP